MFELVCAAYQIVTSFKVRIFAAWVHHAVLPEGYPKLYDEKKFSFDPFSGCTGASASYWAADKIVPHRRPSPRRVTV
ncbi:MAG TPA: hypothetical protein VKH62_08000, partial [Candidatus Binatia bacterium]|nr:hypothetical protein [Candidatus Binatia bacterium]